MSLRLTPQRLAAVYEMLRAMPPFCGWGLPPSSGVKFHVSRDRATDAAWWIDGERHSIEVSQARTGLLSTLIVSMAHEMIHAWQRIKKSETNGVQHNAEFRRIARAVCKRYGWDDHQFL